MLTFTNLTAASDGTNGTSHNTASISPTGNRLVVVAVMSKIETLGVDPAIPTLSGGGMTTWDLVGTFLYDNSGAARGRLSLFRAMQASPGSGAITITHSTTAEGLAWSVEQSSDEVAQGSNGANAILQPTDCGHVNNAATGDTITLAAFGDADNVGYVASVRHTAEGTTPPTGWTELGDTNTTVGTTIALGTSYGPPNDNTANPTWATSNTHGSIAMEVVHSAVNPQAPSVNEGAGESQGQQQRVSVATYRL